MRFIYNTNTAYVRTSGSDKPPTIIRTIWRVAKNSTRLKQEVTLPDLYQQYRHRDAHQENRREI